MNLGIVTGQLLSPPTMLEDEMGAHAAMGIDLAPPDVNPPDILELGLFCHRFLIQRLMCFKHDDVITVDGEFYRRIFRHQDGRVTRFMVDVTRILSIESREMMELNLDDPVAFEVYLARKKDR